MQLHLCQIAENVSLKDTIVSLETVKVPTPTAAIVWKTVVVKDCSWQLQWVNKASQHFAQPQEPQPGVTMCTCWVIFGYVSRSHPKSNCSITCSSFTNLRSHENTNHMTSSCTKETIKVFPVSSSCPFFFPLFFFSSFFHQTTLCLSYRRAPYTPITLVLHSSFFGRNDTPFLVCSFPVLKWLYTHSHSLAAQQTWSCFSTLQPCIWLFLTTEGV